MGQRPKQARGALGRERDEVERVIPSGARDLLNYSDDHFESCESRHVGGMVSKEAVSRADSRFLASLGMTTLRRAG
jgi:hypothetical protein